MQFFSLYRSKIEVSETYVFDIVIIPNDHPSYVKHILACVYMVFPYFGCVLLGVDSLRGGLAEGNRIAKLTRHQTPAPLYQKCKGHRQFRKTRKRTS